MTRNDIQVDVWALGALFVAAVLLYLRSVGGDFIWDDDANVTVNPLLSGPDSLRRIWFSGEGYQYYPLTFTSYWLQDQIVGLSARSCHWVNLVLHALNSCLLYLILRQLRFPAAFGGALLFALHPVGVETVAWITERKNLLSGALSLCSAFFFLRFLVSAESKTVGRRLYWISWITFALAVLAKTHAVVLPAILFIFCLWLRQLTRSRLVQLLPFFAVSAILSVVTIQMEARHVFRDSAGQEWDLSVLAQLLNAGKILVFYLQKVIAPLGLTFIYNPWTVDPARGSDWVPLLGLCGVFVVGVILAARSGSNRARAGLFLAASYVLLLSPVLGFFDVYFMRYAWVQDHFQYFALMAAAPGLAGIIAWVADRVSVHLPVPAPRVGALGIAFAAVWFAVLSWEHQGDFRDPVTLWSRTLERSPRAWMAATNLGILRGSAGQSDSAIALHRRAVEIDSTRAEPHNNLGFELARTGDHAAATEAYQRAIVCEPGDPVAYFNLGNSFFQLGQPSEAIFHYERALKIQPSYPAALNSLGTVLAATGRLEPAINSWARALVQDEEFLDAYTNLAVALTRSLGTTEANQTASRFCRNDAAPRPAFLALLARTRLGLGDRKGAVLAAEQAEDALGAKSSTWLREEIRTLRAAAQRQGTSPN